MEDNDELNDFKSRKGLWSLVRLLGGDRCDFSSEEVNWNGISSCCGSIFSNTTIICQISQLSMAAKSVVTSLIAKHMQPGKFS